MIVNHIEQILADAGIRVEVEWQDNGLWLITDILYRADNPLIGFEDNLPFEIPSMQPEKWLAAVIAGETELAHSLEVGVDHAAT